MMNASLDDERQFGHDEVCACACAGLRVCWFAGLLGNILHINTILFHGYYVNAADAEVGWGVGR